MFIFGRAIRLRQHARPAVVSEVNVYFTFVIHVRVKMSHRIMSHENNCGYYFHSIRHTGKVSRIALWVHNHAILRRHLFHVGWKNVGQHDAGYKEIKQEKTELKRDLKQ